MISAAIFDLDGLMFDSEDLRHECWVRALEDFGYEMTQTFEDASGGISRVRMLEVLREVYGADMPAERLLEYEWSLVDEVLAGDVPEKPGLRELLGWLEDHDVPRAIASSSPMRQIDACLDGTGLRERFDVVVSGTEVARSKPAPDVFLEAASRLGVEPATSLVLEDSFAGVRAGAAGGFVTVMVPDALQPDDEIRSLVAACCEDLGEVASLLEAGRL